MLKGLGALEAAWMPAPRSEANNEPETPTYAAKMAGFPAGTLIHTSNGTKPIETVTAGQQVCSRNEHNREPGLRMVIAAKSTPGQRIHELIIGDPWGESETLLTVAGQAFWVTNVACNPAEAGDAQTRAQWVRAASLTPGMHLVNLRGQTLMVQTQRDTAETASVYSLNVREHRTCHVGRLGIWAHSMDCW